MFLNLVDPVVQLMIIRSDPGYFFSVLGNTFVQNFQFYYESMIGLFGWRDTPLPAFMIYGCTMVSAVVLYRVGQLQKLKIPFMHLIILSMVCIATPAAFLWYFYLNGTPVASPIVDSMQGRYFLPIAPLVLFVILQWSIYVRKILFIFIPVCIVFVFGITVNLFFTRYYDYRTVFDDPMYLRDQVKKGTIVIENYQSMYISTPSSYLYDVKNPNYKIGGFEVMTMKNTHIDRVAVPYRVSISDPTCTKEYWHGYLDQTELQDEHVVTVKTEIVPLRTSTVCVTFSPIIRPGESRFMTIAGTETKPIVEFLYLKK